MGSADNLPGEAPQDSQAHTNRNSKEISSERTSQTIHDTSLQQKEHESDGSGDGSEANPRTVHGWKWAAAATTLYIGALIYGLDGTIAADIQSSIIEQFRSVEKLTWIGTAFPLGSVCAIMPGYVMILIGH